MKKVTSGRLISVIIIITITIFKQVLRQKNCYLHNHAGIYFQLELPPKQKSLYNGILGTQWSSKASDKTAGIWRYCGEEPDHKLSTSLRQSFPAAPRCCSAQFVPAWIKHPDLCLPSREQGVTPSPPKGTGPASGTCFGSLLFRLAQKRSLTDLKTVFMHKALIFCFGICKMRPRSSTSSAGCS